MQILTNFLGNTPAQNKGINRQNAINMGIYNSKNFDKMVGHFTSQSGDDGRVDYWCGSIEFMNTQQIDFYEMEWEKLI